MAGRWRNAVELAYYLAINGADTFGAIHVAVTERRIYQYVKQRSTSCGDLLHCVAYAIGCRSPAVNRAEYKGWKPSVNLSRWFVPPLPHDRIWRPRLDQIRPGDFLCYDYTSRKAHGLIYLGMTVDGRARTADFGQPGGRLFLCDVAGGNGAPLRFRGRQVDCAVPLRSVATEAPALTVGEWLAAHEIDPAPWFEEGLTVQELLTPDEYDRTCRDD